MQEISLEWLPWRALLVLEDCALAPFDGWSARVPLKFGRIHVVWLHGNRLTYASDHLVQGRFCGLLTGVFYP